MPQYPYVVESETTIEYPKSKRKIVLDNTGRVVSDSAKDNK
jgi:hypothetical protein